LSLILQLARIRNELQNLLKLALPIMIGQLAVSAMGFVDTVMAGKVSPHDLAFVALGNSIWVPTMLFMGGIILVVAAKVAHLFGASKLHLVGALVHQAWYLAIVLGVLGSLFLVYVSEYILYWLKVDATLIEPTLGYLYGIALGFPAMALYQVLRSTSEGLGITRPNMFFSIIGLLVNIPLNYVFIFGHLGFPKMGGVGCGFASGFIMWLMLLLMFSWSKLAIICQQCNLYKNFELPNFTLLKQLLSVGIPIGIAIFVETSMFSVVALLIGGLGAKIVASHQIALNFSGLVFMIPYSLGMAITVRVGQALGRKKPNDAKFAVVVGLSSAIFYACCSCLFMILLRTQIAQFYSNDVQVIALAAGLIVYSAVAQFSDCLQVCSASALRGYQDTKIAMIMIVFSYWIIGVPLGYILGLTDIFTSKQGPAGLWQGFVVGLTLSAVLMLGRLFFTIKKSLLK